MSDTAKTNHPQPVCPAPPQTIAAKLRKMYSNNGQTIATALGESVAKNGDESAPLVTEDSSFRPGRD